MRALSFLDFEGAYGNGSKSGRKRGYTSVCRNFPESLEMWVLINVGTQEHRIKKKKVGGRWEGLFAGKPAPTRECAPPDF
jgi:hypothetical protein